MAERGWELAPGEDKTLGDLGASDLVDVRQRRLLLPKRRCAAPLLPRPGPWVAHGRSVGGTQGAELQ